MLYVYAISMLAAEKRDEEGATATEYALLIAGIAVGLLGAIAAVQRRLQRLLRGPRHAIGI